MPNTKAPRIPTYRLHKPTNLAVVRLHGRDIYLGRYGSAESRQAYERAIAEWLANGRQLPPATAVRDREPAPTVLTVNELLVAYWEHAQRYYVKNGKPTGELPNMRDAMKPLARLYGTIQAADFGPRALKAVRQAMADADLCRSVINARINRVRRIFKWGVENQLVEASILHALQAMVPLKRGRCQVRESDPVKPVPQAHVDQVMPLVPRQVQAMIQLQLLTGMRPGEVTIMRGCDLDMTGRIWVYTPVSHKTEP